MKQKINEVLETHDIEFNDEFSLEIFDSHMNSLINRIKDQEVLESSEDEYISIMDEISEEALIISEELMNLVFANHTQPESKMELVLIATHIQNSLNNKEKEESQ